jgi:hypothetical protein
MTSLARSRVADFPGINVFRNASLIQAGLELPGPESRLQRPAPQLY